MVGSFKNRLLILLVSLVLIGQGVTAVLALAYLQRNVRAEAADRLVLSRDNLSRLLQSQAEKLRLDAQVLVKDYAFRDAAATADRGTLVSALRNHSQRVHADLALLYDTDGKLLASTDAQFDGIALSAGDEGDNLASWSFALVGDHAAQIVYVPVKAPEIIGWVALGFTLDQSLVRDLAKQSGTDVSLIGRTTGSIDPFAVSTLPPPAAGQLAWQNIDRAAGNAPWTLNLAGANYLTLTRALPVQGGQLWLVAQRPLTEVLGQYQRMRLALLGIAGLTIAIAMLLAWITGRNAARPLAHLVDAARRIQRGEDADAVPLGSAREFAQLGATFNSMQDGIRERESRILFSATHDALTGLPNRQALREMLPQCFAGAQEASLLLVDVHQFRDINASVGHATGDEVLQALAAQFLYLAGANGVCARIGADQFAVASVSAASSLQHRFMVLAEELRHGLAVGALTLNVELRGGIVPWSDGAGSVDVLLRRADAALLQAKDRGEIASTYLVSSEAEQQRRIMLVSELRGAITRRELHLVYQPMVRLTDRMPENYEALVRWRHATLGPISPAEFIPLAERASLMRPLSQQVLEMAIAQLGFWRMAGFTPLVSVNLSAYDLADGDLCMRVLTLLREHQVEPQQLLLEVTETAVMRDAQQARQIMHQLRMAGVRFAIDDFGTGHSSLAQLQQLPVDELKIDRSFVDGLENSPGNQAIVRAATELAHTLGLRVVAEGVETMASWGMLLRLGADVAQGYLVSRPMPAADVHSWTQKYVASLDQAIGDAERDGRVTPLKSVPG